MSDLIDRQAAIDALEDAEDAFGYLTRDWREVLMELPFAQPDIIRCKDCKWWDRYNDDNGYCMAAKSCTYTTHWEIQIRRKYDGDFYCADAEPKEEYEEDEDE